VKIFRIFGTFSDELRVLIYRFGCVKYIHSGFIQVFLKTEVVRPGCLGHPDGLNINPRWRHLKKFTKINFRSPLTNISNIIHALMFRAIGPRALDIGGLVPDSAFKRLILFANFMFWSLLFLSRTIANYVMWHLVESLLSYLPNNFRDAHVRMLGVTSGVSTPTERWKFCAHVASSIYGFALSALYIRDYAKEETIKTVCIINSFAARGIYNDFKKNEPVLQNPFDEMDLPSISGIHIATHTQAALTPVTSSRL
jgi:hypothetical protein